MAQVQLNIVLPDNKITDVVEAVRAYDNVPTATQQEIKNLLENEAKTRIRNAYVAYMRSKVYDISLD